MIFGLEHIGIALGAIASTWIVNNKKLRDGITEWIVNKTSNNNLTNIDHTVVETITSLMYESSLQEFNNQLKEELYKYYMDTCFNGFLKFIEEYNKLSKKYKLVELKKETKLLLYSTLNQEKHTIDNIIKMPDSLQNKFDTFRNYLNKQHLYVLERALTSNSKVLLNIQLLDALETNIRWTFFYTTDMFEGFNGQFDTLSKSDVFKQ